MYEATSGFVLLVEDNDINQIVAGEILGDFGMIVEIAGNGAIALDMIGRKTPPYQAILMDLQMPVMDGREATRRIRTIERYADTPIIAMTAHAISSEKALSLAAGMTDYVIKPVSPNVLREVLCHWLVKIPEAIVLKKTASEASVPVEYAPPAFPENLPGIDVPLALKRMLNKKALFIKIATGFRDRYADAAEQMLNCMITADFEDLSFRAHTLKGVAASLAAENLKLRCIEVEEASDAHSVDAAVHAITALALELKTIVDGLIDLERFSDEPPKA